jgi:hypothetical protein
VNPAPVRWTSRIFGASWLSYFSLYFTRKHFSVVKSSLGIDEVWLGYIDLGWLRERADRRRHCGRQAGAAACRHVRARRVRGKRGRRFEQREHRVPSPPPITIL